MVFTIFCFLVDKKIKIKVLAGSLNYLLILKTLPATCCKKLQINDFDTENAYKNPPVIL